MDAHLPGSVPGRWAAGHMRCGPAFTHVAYADLTVLADRIAGSRTRNTERVVPHAMVLDPELGRPEAEARRAGHRMRIGPSP